MLDIGNEIELVSLMRILKETGIKGVMEYSDVIVLNHLIQRGQIGHSRNQIIETLKEQTTMSFGEIMNLYNRFDNFRNHLPSYELETNMKLDKLDAETKSVIPFTKIGDRLVGILEDGRGGHVVYDGRGKHLIELCKITKDFHVIWNEHWNIHPSVNHYITKQVKLLKERIW